MVRLILMISILQVLVVFGARATIPLDQDDLLENLGVFSPGFFAELQDIHLDGDRAFSFGVGGLAILDISNTARPAQLGRFEPVGHPYVRFYRGAVHNDLAIGGAREDLAFIVNISNHDQPTLAAVHGFPGQSFEGAAIIGPPGGETAFLCAHGDGLEIVNVGFPADPRSLASVTSLINAWDVAVIGSFAYVADGAGGLAVIDIGDPENPVHLSSLPTSGAAADVVAEGQLLVVSCGSAGIDIFTLDDPATPAYASTANTSGLAITSALSGSQVFVADWDDVESFDLSDPWNPVPLGGEFTPVRAMGLDARAGLVAVNDWSKVRLYRPGASLAGDIAVSVDHLVFDAVPVGQFADQTFILGNTGGGPIQVQGISLFNPSFQVLPPASFVVNPDQTREVTVRFTPSHSGYDGTFLRIDSDDTDEPQITFSVSSDDNPNLLDLGDPAPDFSLTDLGGASHQLSAQLGKVVVMAFFANW